MPSKNNASPKTRSSTSGSEDYYNQPNPRASKFLVMDGVEADDQTDEDDEDEDQEDNDDEDEAMDTGDFIDMDWQEALPASAAAAQRQTSFTHATNRSPSCFLPAQSDMQRPFDPSPAIAEQWNGEDHDPGVYSSTSPFNFVQSNYPNNNSRMSILSNVGNGGTDGTDGTASSMSLHQAHSPYKHGVSVPVFPTQSTTNNATIDGLLNSPNCMTRKEMLGSLTHGGSALPTSPSSPPCSSAAHKYQEQDHNSPVGSQCVIDQHQDSRSAPQGHSPMVNSEASERTTTRTSSGPSPLSKTASDVGNDLRHVSIDATCTTEQLGNLMQAVVGLAKSVTVKVKP